MDKRLEAIGDLIYETLKSNGIKENRAFITDIVSDAVWKDGYHKLQGEPPSDERIYPCSDCGKMRSKAEGGTVFTVCEKCWAKHYHRPK